MPVSYKLPKINADEALHLDTPLAADTVLASGRLTIRNEAGANGLVVKIGDVTSFSYNAYAAGTPNVVTAVLTGVTMVAGGIYSLTVTAPYVQNFFGGGQESGAIYQTRTYTVSFAAAPALAPTVDQLGAALADRIAADTNAYFTASYNAGTDTLTITADSALAGPLTVVAPAGAVVADATAWVSPSGVLSEVSQYVNESLLGGATYHRFVIRYRKSIRHNAVTGNEVVKPSTAIVYMLSTNGGTAAAVTLLTNILSGASTAANYLGAPQV
jgi:hypothetical protein